jgi:hypothetical protein
MLIKANVPTTKVCRLEIDNDTQLGLCRVFSDATIKMRYDKMKIPFDGNYKPLEDEYLSIGNFQLCEEIKDAVRNPLGIPPYCAENESFPEIKAIFIGNRENVGEGERFVIAFQRFRKEQYISPIKWFNLFFDNNVFVQEKRFGISISDTVDCFFDETELQFASYFFARQIFDLSNYYRMATDQEVLRFSNSDKLTVSDISSFQNLANSWVRRKIASVNDSGILENYTAVKIKSLAKATGIDIAVENKRIVIPTEKETLKVILGFLDEEAYRGPFSQMTYLANSKRKVSKLI